MVMQGKGRGATGRQIRQGMTKAVLIGGVLALVLAGCNGTQVTAPARADLAMELVRLDTPGPPKSRHGECWAAATTPAVIETVTEQIVVAEEVRDDSGRVTTPAAFQTKTHQRMVQMREEVWFHVPCPAEVTVNFVASVQRAMKARGLFPHPVTGMMDPETAEAIRRYQADRGLDSPILSLAAAKELGLIATDLSDL
jgi:hypothetical protein